MSVSQSSGVLSSCETITAYSFSFEYCVSSILNFEIRREMTCLVCAFRASLSAFLDFASFLLVGQLPGDRYGLRDRIVNMSESVCANTVEGR